LFAQRLTENESYRPSPLLGWIMTQGQKTWSDWGKSQTKWKYKTVQYGNSLLDRIDWEEYSLKTVHDPKTTIAKKVSGLDLDLWLTSMLDSSRSSHLGRQW
jgi:Mitochondrial K+-H+ exchange-related